METDESFVRRSQEVQNGTQEVNQQFPPKSESEKYIPRSLHMGDLSSPDRSDSSLLTKYRREVTSKQGHHDAEVYNRESHRDQSGDTYARMQKLPRNTADKSDESSIHPTRDELGSFRRTIDSMSLGDVTESDRAILSELYVKYKIPPPQYNVSTSFREDSNSSRNLSDLEAPPPKSGSVPAFKTLQEQQVQMLSLVL